ncbi:MAG: CvpA family protein [Tepidibacillus sp.]
MNTMDLIIVIIIIVSIFRGYQLGLIRQFIHFIGFFLSLYLAYRFSGELVPLIQSVVPMPTFEQSSLYLFSETFQLPTMFYNAIAFFLIFFGTKLILNIGGNILHQIASLPGIAIVNRLSGALLGLVQILFILIILVHILSVMPWAELKNVLEGSYFAKYTLQMTPAITEKLYHLWNTSNSSYL